MTSPLRLAATAFLSAIVSTASADETSHSPELRSALEKAGLNRPEIQGAIDRAPSGEREAMVFLVENMPERDLLEIKADFLLDNSRLAHQALDEAPWGKSLPRDVFLNDVLPYAIINERREAWRKEFRDRFLPWVKDAKGPGEAAAILNQRVFPAVDVRYSTGRPKADQSPFESIAAKKASCTGLSVLLVDACRAVGVPARLVGTPLWADGSGNHSWVEVWDGRWRFTGAAEPSGLALDQAWFGGRASQAQIGDPRKGIFATSWRRTPISFPMVWARDIAWVPAVEVTERYTVRRKELAPGLAHLRIRVLERAGGQRVAADVRLLDGATGRELFKGAAKDERFDLNDHLEIEVPVEKALRLEIRHTGRVSEETILMLSREALETIVLDPVK